MACPFGLECYSPVCSGFAGAINWTPMVNIPLSIYKQALHQMFRRKPLPISIHFAVMNMPAMTRWESTKSKARIKLRMFRAKT